MIQVKLTYCMDPSGKTKGPYIPSIVAVSALKSIVETVESMTLPDRGHVVARLINMYGKKQDPPAKPKKKTVAAPREKLPWKKALEESEEYKLFVKLKTPKGAPSYKENTEEYTAFREAQSAYIGKQKALREEYYSKHEKPKPPAKATSKKRKGTFST